jgi:hypothetical protein
MMMVVVVVGRAALRSGTIVSSRGSRPQLVEFVKDHYK